MITVEEFVPHNGTMKTWDHLAIGLPLLGHIHSIFSKLTLHHDVGYKPFANHISAETALSMTHKGCARMRTWPNMTDYEKQVADTAEALAEHLSTLEPRLPCQLVHGDFWDNNVLFQDNRINLVGDFDFMGMRPRIDKVELPPVDLVNMPANMMICMLYYNRLNLSNSYDEAGTCQQTVVKFMILAKKSF